ncbi:MAG: ORF6N domain-containing protein [Bacteroidales bacterium]|nr:ORF6N domain-containing protein [Bacteroidales bacterium]
MNKEVLTQKKVEEKIISIRNQQVMLDAHVAYLYGVETKRINEAVKKNPNKFPKGYVFELTAKEWREIKRNNILLFNNISSDYKQPVENIDRLKHSSSLPKAFTEKGLYMLATILKSEKATQTTISIIETFTQLRELSRTLHAIPEIKDTNNQKTLIQKGNELLSELLDDNMKISCTETTVELNFAVMKLKHTIKRKKD